MSLGRCYLYCNGLMDHIYVCQNAPSCSSWYRTPTHFTGTLVGPGISTCSLSPLCFSICMFSPFPGVVWTDSLSLSPVLCGLTLSPGCVCEDHSSRGAQVVMERAASHAVSHVSDQTPGHPSGPGPLLHLSLSLSFSPLH